MTEFINMFKNYANFNDRTTVRGFWMAYLFNIIASIIVGVIANILKLPILSSLYSLAILVPSIAIAIRRLRDAGKPLWAWVIPIYNLVCFCQPSAPDDGRQIV